MKFRINPLVSDILISIYIILTLFLRFKFENQTAVSPMLSVVMGVCFVVIIWALVKLKILNPNWFGLFNSKKS
jgi:preprotein translocase subunit SecF